MTSTNIYFCAYNVPGIVLCQEHLYFQTVTLKIHMPSPRLLRVIFKTSSIAERELLALSENLYQSFL